MVINNNNNHNKKIKMREREKNENKIHSSLANIYIYEERAQS